MRIPFRLDLRDYAAWMDGRASQATEGSSNPRDSGIQSLESFLSVQVSGAAGGVEVSASDLLDLVSGSHCLIVLDGFDEVADLTTRERIVEEIRRATSRLEVHAESLQVIVTSRPAAFANSPGFPEEDWVHLELEDLRLADIMSYQKKWTVGQELCPKERSNIARTLTSKLEQPHLRDLARNPMQLSILLHLMHVQGVAFPEKRTALYEEYMRLFFNREAEKSSIVRDHREVILAIHGVLAWELHTQVERGKGSGTISKTALQSRIRGHLESQGYDPYLVGPLLRGSFERVGALVSRLVDTFEFEVQPLREYFAASHLYKTAPQSRPGNIRTGTRPDRFDALARSAYWTNVVRFFCGFYDVGELGTLADGLIQLDDDVFQQLTNHPRRLAMMLLSDHVFSQSPITMTRLIKQVMREPAFERLMVSEWDLRRPEVSLPATAGRKILFDICLDKLEKEDDSVNRHLLRQLLRINAERETLVTVWTERHQRDHDGCDPLEEAADFGIVDQFDVSKIKTQNDGNQKAQARWLIATNGYEHIFRDRDLSTIVHRAYFDNEITFMNHKMRKSRWAHLEVLSVVLRLNGLVYLCHYRGKEVPAYALIAESFGFDKFKIMHTDYEDGSGDATSIQQFSRFVVRLMDCGVSEWQTKLHLWSSLVDRGFEVAPRSRMFQQIAAISTAINPVDGSGTWDSRGFSPARGLVDRLHYALGRSGDSAWWNDRLSEVAPAEGVLRLAIFLSWCKSQVLSELSALCAQIAAELDESDWDQLYDSCRRIRSAAMLDSSGLIDSAVIEKYLGVPRVSLVLVGRVGDDHLRRRLFRRAFAEYEGQDRFILEGAADTELICAGQPAEDVDWEHVGRVSMLARRAGVSYISSVLWPEHDWKVPAAFAMAVLTHVGSHCGQLVSMCERSYAGFVAGEIPSVSAVAERDGWFSAALGV